MNNNYTTHATWGPKEKVYKNAVEFRPCELPRT